MEELLQEMEAYAQINHVPIINERGREAFIRIIKENNPHRVLEIGTAIGYSTLLLACYGASDVHITTVEISDERAKIADEYWCKSSYREHIEIIKGDAGEVLCSLKPPEEGFDFVFIDAAKGQYLDYFQKIQPFLSSKAVIVADNVLFRGYVLGDEKPPRRYKTIVKRLRAYLDLVKHTPGFRTKILENGDGLSVTYKDILEEKS